jgi:hypothetical protein
MMLSDETLMQDVPKQYFRDLGNLMLAATMLWGYTSFSQYLITYNGNTVEEIGWYVHRNIGGWQWVSRALLPFHFALPFLVLLIGSEVKRNPRRLAKVAGWIVFMRFVDLFWWVVPTFRDHFSVTLSDIGAPLLLGGIWLYFWAGQMKGRDLFPAHDPRMEGYWPVTEGAHHV